VLLTVANRRAAKGERSRKECFPRSASRSRSAWRCQLLPFFEDAALCERELRLAVRNLAADSEPEKIPSCGLPVRALDEIPGLTAPARAGGDV
jgi:hypothetical protein